MNAYTGPPMTLGNAAKAGVRLIVWCKTCRQVPEWRERVCSRCGSREIDMVVTGTERR